MLQIILAILLLIPTLCHAQGTRMSNGAAATSGASILTGITEEPPASGEESLGASGIFACSWEDGSDELNTGAGTGHVWDSEAGGSSTLLSKGTTAGYGFSGDQSAYLILTGSLNNTDYLTRIFDDVNNFGIRLSFYLDSGFTSDDSTGCLFLQTMGTNGTAPTGVQARITRVSGVQTLNVYSYTTAWTSMGTYALAEDTWYQLRIRWTKAGSNGASWSLTTEAGGEVSTGTLSGTTANVAIDQIRLGSLSSPFKSVTLRLDALFSTNSYTLPDLKVW
jgi:hypothetical protein